MKISEQAMRYRPRRCEDPARRNRLVAIASERPRWGRRRLIIMSRRDGRPIDKRAFRRVDHTHGLHVRHTRKRHVRYVQGNVPTPDSEPDERWSLDFIHLRTAHGRAYRFLNVSDDYTGDLLALEAACSFGSAHVMRVLARVASERSLPTPRGSDNGSDICSHRMSRRAAESKLQLHFTRPGTRQ